MPRWLHSRMGDLVDVPLGNDGVAGHRDHLAFFKLLSSLLAPPFSLPGMVRLLGAVTHLERSLLVASITRISTMAYTSIR